jgi:hypothetical protein
MKAPSPHAIKKPFCYLKKLEKNHLVALQKYKDEKIKYKKGHANHLQA